MKAIHKIVHFTKGNPFKIVVVSALKDNYSYLLIDECSNTAMAVDSFETQGICDALEGSQLKCVMTTHHHDDHSGGNLEMAKRFPGITVYGFDSRVPGINNHLQHGQIFSFGKLEIEAIHCPCHTSGSLCLVVHDRSASPSAQAIFTGDTLFLGGCGRFFEGTPEDMYSNLVEKIGSLPKSVKIFAGHEYTKKNLEFALTVEPSNQHIHEKLRNIHALEQSGRPIITMPGTIEEEFLTNPFMRLTNSPEIAANLSTDNVIDAMRKLRKLKDNF